MARMPNPFKQGRFQSSPLPEFVEADEAQQAVLLTAGQERKVLGRIRGKIERGAEIEDCEYYFDARLGIVRHKRENEGAG